MIKILPVGGKISINNYISVHNIECCEDEIEKKESHKVAFWAPEVFCYFFWGFICSEFLMYALCFSSDNSFLFFLAISKKDQYSKYKEGNHYHANNNEFTNLAWNYKKRKTTQKIENANKIFFPPSSSSSFSTNETNILIYNLLWCYCS